MFAADRHRSPGRAHARHRSGRLVRACLVVAALAWPSAGLASESRLAANLADMAEVRAEMLEALQDHRRSMAGVRLDAARSLRLHRQGMAAVRADMDQSRSLLLQRMKEARER